MSNYPEDKKIIKTLIKEARRCMDEGYYEEAISKLQKCLSMDIGLKDRLAVSNELGYCSPDASLINVTRKKRRERYRDQGFFGT